MAFLSNIKALSGILGQVLPYIGKIVSLVKEELPEIIKNKQSIEAEIKRRNAEKIPLVNELAPLTKELNRMEGEISAELAKYDAANKNTPYSRAKYERGKIRDSYIAAHPEFKKLTAKRNELKAVIEKNDKDISARQHFCNRLAGCESVAKRADEFKGLLDAMHPHEEAIATIESEQLVKFDSSKMKPVEIDNLKTNVLRKYKEQHDEYKTLTTKRDEILEQIDKFSLANFDENTVNWGNWGQASEPVVE